jgi:PPOX class probable F420-dependent enzyme
VAILVDHYEEDWSRLWWVRIDGRALELEAGEEAEGALRRLRDKYAQYAAAPPEGPVLRIDAERWVGWSAS